jgi:hypothetical protein
MQSRTALFGTTLLAAALIIASPRLSLSPGPMTRGHEDIANDCLGCHTPLRGLPTARCVSCHPLDSIGTSRRGVLRPTGADTALAGMHNAFAQTDCLECHSDHAGPDPANATREFSHEALSSDFRQRCTTCHDGNRPVDDLHRQMGDDCGGCHTTTEWKPATFDHQKVATRRTCTACHEQKRPADELHRQVGDDCGGCHTTTEWKPATFDHQKVATRRTCTACHEQKRPVDDLHRQMGDDCGACHTTTEWKPATFEHQKVASRRTCTACHEQKRPADELHRQVGDDCGACHTTTEWKPATFDHQKFGMRQGCTGCHERKRPTDELHRPVGGDCAACHTTSTWKPATFEHNQYFVLDRDHRTTCRTCHTETASYKSYTCYGCHEHTESRMIAKHREEGVSNLRDCVRCHRSADEHEGGREGGREHHEDDD